MLLSISKLPSAVGEQRHSPVNHVVLPAILKHEQLSIAISHSVWPTVSFAFVTAMPKIDHVCCAFQMRTETARTLSFDDLDKLEVFLTHIRQTIAACVAASL